MPPQESSAFPENFPDPKLPAAVEVDEMLTRIKHSHGHYYKVMNLEVWALVETLDHVFPGAWGHFMANRQVAVKQFLERSRDPNSSVDAEQVEDKEEEPPPTSRAVSFSPKNSNHGGEREKGTGREGEKERRGEGECAR